MQIAKDDLAEIAKEAMIARGLIPDFPPNVLQEAKALVSTPVRKSTNLRDLRDWLFVSIDNETSLDLDQLTYADQDRIFIAIADVALYVKRDSPIDRYAKHNTTSVYTPARIFPMLPPECSNGITSLNEEQDRSAIVVELRVDEKGDYLFERLYPALVRNQAKLNYPEVTRWLEEKIPLNDRSEEVHEQLMLQDQLAQRIFAFRTEQGALGFETAELEAIMEQGKAIALKVRKSSRAHQLIENFMIAANVGVTNFFLEHQLPILRRIVRVPKRWDRIVHLARERNYLLPPKPDVQALRDFLMKEHRERPDQFPDLSLAVIKLLGRGEYVLGLPGKPALGHFDLALRNYAHTTAPNRRYPDLIMQRILKKESYRSEELIHLARQCTEREDDATKVERRLIKCAAAAILADQIGKEFPAMVTGSTPKGIWVRLKDPPLEGKLIHGCEGVDVGDQIKVRLAHVDVRQGHLDFDKCSS